ncbi:CapA family protein [Patescibacteria group bacterium]|nr:CapA family protein [Patescibacteria group bacterium]
MKYFFSIFGILIILGFLILLNTKFQQQQYKVSNPVSKMPNEGPSLLGMVPIKTGGEAEISEITLLFGGDVMLGRYVNVLSNSKKDYTWMFKNSAEFLKNADLTVVNLESPFVKNCPLTSTGMKFCANDKSVEGLKFAGIDVVGIANNHILNYGTEGFENTKKVLSSNEIEYTGDGSILYKTLKRVKFSFIAFNDVGNVGSEIFGVGENAEKMTKLIKEAKEKSDIVIVSFHFGQEYIATASDRQKYLSYLAIDTGADVIIGHHPHWMQNVELYKDKPIFYSLGNLVFDQMWSENTRLGMLAKLTFKGNKYSNYELFYTKIFDYGRVVLLD